MNTSTRIILLTILIALDVTGCWVQEWAHTYVPLQSTPTRTATAIPTSEPPYEPPTISAPADGAILDTNFPDFQIGSPRGRGRCISSFSTTMATIRK